MQKDILKSFNDMKNKETQDEYLGGLITVRDVQRRRVKSGGGIPRAHTYLCKQSRFQTITHMFSELSHSFLPCDRSFGLVESQKRKHMFRRNGIKSSKTAPKSLKSF
ncbi:hypothetical protein ANN_14207 [Periplaneta americana]|uniref:Uncharacterized protein n=1 Tax=Periplaneta americana TaxID=6978 RepID=A0ABQ8SVN7_PERAM|nr:hypothetical protein ANN_14207 [Periplaneta americana]